MYEMEIRMMYPLPFKDLIYSPVIRSFITVLIGTETYSELFNRQRSAFMHQFSAILVDSTE
jgi:hypothetical protein